MISSNILLMLFTIVSASEPLSTAGKLDAVTVYRGEALVTRVVDVSGEPGLREVVVTELPTEIQPESIFAESDGGLNVRSIRYRVRPVAEDVREEVRALDKSIADLAAKISLTAKRKGVAAEDRAYLKQLESFVAPTATVEMTKGVLNPATIESITKFMASERTRLAQEEHDLEQQSQQLEQELNLLQRQREQVAAGAAKSVREAIVFLDMPQAGGKFRLRYLVRNATWSPSYNFRATTDQKDVVIEYNASIQQSSGEDWNDVAMTLSTATASLVAKGPTLTSLHVRLEAHEAAVAQQAASESGLARRMLRDELKKAEVARNKAAQNEQEVQSEGDRADAAPTPPTGQVVGGGLANVPATRSYDLRLNELAANIQVLDLNRRLSERKAQVPENNDEGVSITYTLAGRLSMPSRSDQQLVQVASTTMSGEFAKIATPLLTEYVYEEATLANQSDLVLLAGPASSFVDGKFVGQGSIPTVAVGEKFSIGFGIDTSLRCHREQVSENEKSQGGNMVRDLGYKIVLENFGSKPAKVRLLDRVPIAKETEVKISLTSPENELSQDAEYLATQRKAGILRWDVEVPASTFGSKAASVSYAFRMEFDKNMRVGGTALAN